MGGPSPILPCEAAPVTVEPSERVIRYVCTRHSHVNAPTALGSTCGRGFAWAWCPSSETRDHVWTQIKDMRSRMADLADVLEVLRLSSTDSRVATRVLQLCGGTSPTRAIGRYASRRG